MRDSASNYRSSYRNWVNTYISWAWGCAKKSWFVKCTLVFVEMSWNIPTIYFIYEVPRTTVLSTLNTPDLIGLNFWIFNVIEHIILCRWNYKLITAVSYDNIKEGQTSVSSREWHGLIDFVDSYIRCRIGENLKWCRAKSGDLRRQRNLKRS